jgi:hypothetical protein
MIRLARISLPTLVTLAIAIAGAPHGAVRFASADPVVRVDYPAGTPRIRLEGDWSGSVYTVVRADRADGAFTPVTAGDVLCTGDCFALDRSAALGSTYWYRFDLMLPGGGTARYGPYPVTLAPELAAGILLRAGPLPARGTVTFELGLAGARDAAPVAAEVQVFDAAGRRVAVAFRGLVGAGTTRVSWQPRASDGHALGAGVYLARGVIADGRRAVTRLVIAR